VFRLQGILFNHTHVHQAVMKMVRKRGSSSFLRAAYHGPMTSEPGRDLHGFTLLEILTVIFIVAVLVGLAIPAFSSWVPDYQLKSAARDLLSNFQLAKLSAVKHNRNCTICFNASANGEMYDYIVFIDENNDLEYDPGERLIAVVRWSEYGSVDYDFSKGGGDGLTFSNNDGGLPTVAFKPNGLPVNNSGGLGMGTVSLTNGKGKKTSVILSSAGNVRIQ
jgi:type IV fimbrial biogenesis protein FimT